MAAARKVAFSVITIFLVAFGISPAGAEPVMMLDSDHDGVPALADNCASDFNPDQLDINKNGVGDACEGTGPVRSLIHALRASWQGKPDQDGDVIPDSVDNCPELANPRQQNLDADSAGDLCDADDDSDNIADATDNCPGVYNQSQIDGDGNGRGDACERNDTDKDGVMALVDNCPVFTNGDQADLDEDGVGDICDDDRDGDGIDNLQDNCSNFPNIMQIDQNGDGIGDICQ